ncbi:MAG: 23S rRNA (uracil(1939)-C(5))-methyltransferase RlmD [Bacteroidetes bacterium]|nr:23S rRNA (uracil(1939)-C(5))-methyltransferase RlmD [Bacteroidota bacterium]
MVKLLEKVEIIDAGSEGNAVARHGDLVVFVPYGVPGDVVDIEVFKSKRSYAEGRIIKFHRYSENRTEPFCSHFGICGGCRWQQMNYGSQLHFKQKQVEDTFKRIAKLDNPLIRPILGSDATRGYRNKLEFTFSSRRWVTGPADGEASPALGFHIPKRWDKVLDIDHCYLMEEPVNAIRLEARRYAIEKGLSFYDARNNAGILRNMILRTTTRGDLMLIMVYGTNEPDRILPMLYHLQAAFPQITSMFYVVNEKKNDIINDLEMRHYAGTRFITEILPPFRKNHREVSFRIGPVSFFQTNPVQAGKLFRIAAEYLSPEGSEMVYDLYTGTGTIANYIAPYVKQVIGIESVASAVSDAGINADLNANANLQFYAAEAEKLLTPGFISEHGHPNAVITDPPRNGMHEKVIQTLLAVLPGKIVYISCNPATQARDIFMLKERYNLVECQPVDMFPHTQHVENVAFLTLA